MTPSSFTGCTIQTDKTLSRQTTMGNNLSSHCNLETHKKTVFSSHEGVVYRIPALIYVGDQKILAFAENRTDPDDTSTVTLDMKTGEVKKNESTHEVTIEVIICINWFIGILLVKILFVTASILS